MAELDLSKVKFPDVMDLRTAAIYLGLSEMRVRTLAREGELAGTKTEDGRWAFAKADLDEFKSRPPKPHARGGGGGRPRGEGKAWIIKVKYADLEAVQAALAQFGIEMQPRYDYAKMVEYRERRKQQKLQEQ